MSGPLGSSQWFKPKQFYPHAINQSLRFEDGDNPRLTQTFSSGDTAKWTLSFWLKLGKIDTSVQYFFHTNLAGANNAGYIYIQDHQLHYWDTALVWETTQLFRDPNAWYNIIVARDSAQSGAAKGKLYVNGTEITDFATDNRSGNIGTSYINSATDHYIGNSGDVDCYIAEMNFIDGAMLTETSFGETKEGIWIPKDTSGLTFGTNGFRLKFQDSSSLGDDTSGKGNDFTSSGLVATDVVPDSPTNNWCTINPLTSLGTQSEGNLKHVTGVSGFGSAVGSIGVTSGKWYWEVTITSATAAVADCIGVVDDTYDSLNSGSAVGFLLGNGGVDSICYYATGNKIVNQSSTAYGASYTTNDIIGVALNLDDNQITFYKNGSSQGAISHTFSGNHILPAASDALGNASATYRFNFGQDSEGVSSASADENGFGTFEYAPPSGFLALCAANLSDPGVDPNEGEEPEDYFNTLLYTGDGNSTQTIGSTSPHILQFNPGFVWIKSRSNTNGHHSLGNKVIGDFFLNSNQKVDEYSFSAFNFNTDNTIDVPVSSNDYSMNTSSQTYVAWNWLAGSSTPTKTYTVKVVSDSGNKYRFDDFGTSAVTLDLQEGGTYTFDQSDSSMSSHPMKLSETANGSHGGGSTYNTGVTYQLDGSEVTESAFVSGFSSATSRKLIITVAASAPTLYYFCHYHSGMGGQVNTNSTFGSSNFSGSIQSKVSENTKAGFSITSFTSTGAASVVTTGHGLSSTPEMLIFKNRSQDNTLWFVYHKDLTNNAQYYLQLSEVDKEYNTSAAFFSVDSTTAGIRQSSLASNGDNCILYSFHSVDGYSKVGSYTGNGDADGVFVYTGFKPAFIIYRETGNDNNWIMLDNKRDLNNVIDGFLYPNLTVSEATGYTILDFCSNGFKHRSTANSGNRSGGSYIYLAFAEQPFKYANAR